MLICSEHFLAFALFQLKGQSLSFARLDLKDGETWNSSIINNWYLSGHFSKSFTSSPPSYLLDLKTSFEKFV